MKGCAILAGFGFSGLLGLFGLMSLFGSVWGGLAVLAVAGAFFGAAFFAIKNSTLFLLLLWSMLLVGFAVLCYFAPPDLGIMDGGPVIMILVLAMAVGFGTSLWATLQRR